MTAEKFIIHTLKGYIGNLFLVDYGDRMLLLDSGSVCDIKGIEFVCRGVLHRNPGDIRLSVITHMHPDHAGGAGILKKRLGTSIAANELVQSWYSGITGALQHKLDCLMTWAVAVRHDMGIRKIFFNRHVDVDFLLKDEDRLPYFEDWKVIHTPGHTLHNIVLFNERESVLYADDCVYEVEGVYNVPISVMFPEMMKDSYEKLARLNARTILLAHGSTIHTDNSADFFRSLIPRVDDAPSELKRQVDRFSVFTPDVWRPAVRKKFSRFIPG